MQAIKSHITRDEYLAFDAASPDKHQFYNGEIFTMAGGSFNHAQIAGNVYNSLRQNNSKKPCQPMNSDMRVSTPSGLDTYPDVSVYCDEPDLGDNNHTLLNPVLIIEVLSPSTRNYDQGEKFLHYRSIESLQDYLLIDSESIHVEHYERKGKHEWLLREYQEATDTITLSSIDQTLDLATLYANTVFK